MNKMKEYYKNHKDRIIKAFMFAFFLFFVLFICIFLRSINNYYLSFQSKLTIVMCFTASVILMSIRVKINKIIRWIFELIILFGFPILIFEEFERFANDMTKFNPDARNINIILIFSLIVLIYGFCQNIGITVGIGGLFFFLLYLINYFTIMFRGTPMILSDFLTWKTAIGVMSSYNYVLNERILTSFFIIALIYSFALFINENEKKKQLRIAIIVIGVTFCVGVYTYVLSSDFFSRNAFRGSEYVPVNAVVRNGLVLNCFISLKESFLEPPEGYSSIKVKEIIHNYRNTSNKNVEDIKECPDIIVIMNESFTDLGYLEKVEFSEEPIPKFKALQNNCIKGTLISSVFGGSTPNSEFEFLSGCTMSFLPSGMIAYQQLIKEALPTFASQLKKYGYNCTAIHLYKPEYFSRNRIYPLLGFDTFINESNSNVNIRYVENTKKNIQGDYTLDKCSFDSIKNVSMEAEKPSFTFCVTVQNHGGYWHQLDDIRITNVESDYANDYVNLIRISDDEFANMLDYYESINNPTIIVMYGDHQPNLYNQFYEDIWMNCDYSNEEIQYMKAKVPFVIWANYDIEEYQIDEMSINYLGPLVLKTANIPMSDYYNYLNSLREEIPVISTVGYVDKDGYFFTDPEHNKYSEKIKEYKYLQYNYLKGNIEKEFYE